MSLQDTGKLLRDYLNQKFHSSSRQNRLKNISMLRHSQNIRRFACFFGALWLTGAGARAQLATSFYNVTGIKTTNLPNAVRLEIQTDGTVYFGGDQKDFINFDNAYEPKATRSFRLRILGARAKLPAFVPIDRYPVDSAGVSVAPADFEIPFFNWEAPQPEPHVDIELRFYVPVKVRQFSVRSGDRGLNFSNTLGPNDVDVEPSRDGGSIFVTVFTDRADTRSQAQLQRSPRENQKQRLEIETWDDATENTTVPNAAVPNAAAPNASFRLDVLHSPLQSVLREVSRVAKTPIAVSSEAQALNVSFLLPRATLAQLLDALARGYGLNIEPRGAGFLIARGLSSTRKAEKSADSSPDLATDSAILDSSPELSTQDLPLQKFALKNLRADRARALLPDFLLSAIRVDADNNALLVSASPEIAQKIGRDLGSLDLPRAQVRVEASLWEFVSGEDADLALQIAFANGGVALQSSTRSGTLALNLGADVTRRFQANLQAQQILGRVRLRARPFVVVASGERGTMFFGQTRYVTVFNGREVNALQLQIGTSLEVTPRVGQGGEIGLDLRPRFSTVDAIDDKTRLPTLGIREFRLSSNVRDGEAMIVSGIASELDFSARRRGISTFSTTQRNRQTTKSVLIVTAKRV